MSYSIIEQLKSECAYYEAVLERTRGKISNERKEAIGILWNNKKQIALYTIEEALAQKGLEELEASAMAYRIYYAHINNNRATADERLQLVLHYIEEAEDMNMLLTMEEVLSERVFAIA